MPEKQNLTGNLSVTDDSMQGVLTADVPGDTATACAPAQKAAPLAKKDIPES